MSAELLREAAGVLRERAEAATPGPWSAVEGPSGAWWVELPNRGDVALDLQGENARHIATMHPGVGLALADLLDTLNYDHDQADLDGGTWDHQVMPLARLILGGAS